MNGSPDALNGGDSFSGTFKCENTLIFPKAITFVHRNPKTEKLFYTLEYNNSYQQILLESSLAHKNYPHLVIEYLASRVKFITPTEQCFVSLIAKHGMDWKKTMVEDFKTAAAEATGIYAFVVQGMRTAGLTELRKKLPGSKIFVGKNKMMTLALGKDEESELKENLHLLANRLRGSCGLLFTDEPEDKVVNFLENFVEMDYDRCGNKANETVVLEEGKLKQFPHSIEPRLRSLGLPTCLQKGVVTLIKEYTVCKKGQVLNSNQAKIKLLEKPMAEFKILLDSSWTQPNDFKIYPRHGGSHEEIAGSDNEMVELDDEVEVLDENEEMEGTTEEIRIK